MILSYPQTRVDDSTKDTLAGVSFEDPYRWLEAGSEEVRHWQRAQANLASSYVREWPPFFRLQQLVAQFSTERYLALPRQAGGLWFRVRTAEGTSQAQALVSSEPMGEGRVLFDPMKANSERPPFVSWVAPSPDGRTLALGICADGSENNKVQLIDVATGQMLWDPPTQTLMDSFTGGVQWLSDSSGFFFSAISGAAVDFLQNVYLHRRAPIPTTVAIDIEWVKGTEYRMVVVSRDGRYAIAVEGLTHPAPVAIARLDEGSLRWRPFVNSIAGKMAGHVVGNRYVAVTDVGAPCGRLVAIDLNTEDANNPENWQELVPESASVLRTVTPVGKALYLTEFVNTYTCVRITDQNGNGLGQVRLPGRGAVGAQLLSEFINLASMGHADRLVFSFSSLTTSPGVYSHTLGRDEVETLQLPQARLDAVVEDRWVVFQMALGFLTTSFAGRA